MSAREALLAHGGGSVATLVHVALPALLVTLAVAGAVALRRSGSGRRCAAAWVLGLAALAAALGPPLESAAQRSLTAHMAQHVLLLLVVAPLLAGSDGVTDLAERVAPRLVAAARSRRLLVSAPAVALSAAALHVVVLLVWHLPAPHERALADDAVHVAEHASLVLVGLLYWGAWRSAVRSRVPGEIGAVLAATLVITAVGLGLGLLMTFASSPWYSAYTGSSTLSPLADQQTAGLLMWAAGGPLYMAAAAWLVHAALADGDREGPVERRVGVSLPGPG